MDTTEGLQKNILDATLRVFDQKGLKFTMDDLAKELSISKKTIYTVYDDKEALFLAMVDYIFGPEMVGEVLDVMKALADDGMSMIVVTHEMRFAREVSDRTIFLSDGIIEEDKPSRELFAHPESPRLVSFLSKVL